ncbi:hypothetical protein [Chryseobacterium sp. Hurlbut01]|uniref:hypothetical protein n=1 Tax=Chryseobacterium sp. Hurlbut01 TaxID=1681828 RepID=UPI00067B0C47|nr:hypothetical protein [Chryseobacterium sp. Hurlbut01]KNB60952.1 hypothetical protein AC804_17550 [Chryseobacterium sp. Hurlbut01]
MRNNFIKKIDKAIISQNIERDFTSIDSELESLGYNIEEINAFSQKLYKRQSFLLKGLINKQKDINLLEKASLMIQKAIEEKIDKPINYLKSLIQNNQFQVQYRNLENLTTDEIKEIIKDQNLLELLEKLENEDQ